MTVNREILEELCSHLLGELTPEQVANMERLVATRPDIRAAVQNLGMMMQILGSNDTTEPPRAVKDRAKSLLGSAQRELAASVDRAGEGIARYVARLVHDSFASRPVGLRGAAAARMMLFECDIAEIDVQVQTSPNEVTGTHTIMGQIGLVETEPLPVRLLIERAESGDSLEILTDHAGMFTVELQPGTYSIRCVLGDEREMIVHGITIP